MENYFKRVIQKKKNYMATHRRNQEIHGLTKLKAFVIILFSRLIKNDLHGIITLLDRMSLRKRKMIVSKRLDDNTLLYTACCLGFNDIVEYLIVECGADVNKGRRVKSTVRTPLQAAMRNGHVSTVAKLKQFGANIHHLEHDQTNTLVYACQCKDLQMGKYFQKNGVNINCKKNVLLCAKYAEYCEFALQVGTDVNFMIYWGRTSLIVSSEFGNLDSVRLLLQAGADKYHRDGRALNALCAAIAFQQGKVLRYFLNNNIYSVLDYASALEVCGGKMIVFNSEFEKGLGLWEESLKLRESLPLGLGCKDVNEMHGLLIDLGEEFKSKTDLKRIRDNKKETYFQVLLVFLRTLPQQCKALHDAFVLTALNKAYSSNLKISLKLIEQLLTLHNKQCSPFEGAAIKAVHTVFSLLHADLKFQDLKDAKVILDSFELFVSFFDTHVWQIPQKQLFRNITHIEGFRCYIRLMLHFIRVLHPLDLTVEENKRFKSVIKFIVKKDFDLYPTSLLHETIRLGISTVKTVSLIIDCGAAVNVFDTERNTPIHVLSECRQVEDDLVRVLLEAGSHIDAVNSNGQSPFQILHELFPLKPLSLQCLGARTICHNAVPVSEVNCPKRLLKFIQLHGKTTEQRLNRVPPTIKCH